MIRRIVSVLMVTTMLLATMVAPAFADSTRVCNNRCGDIDQSTTTDNSVDNSVDNSGQTIDNSVDNSVDNSGQTIDNSVDNNNTTKTCGNISGNNSNCNIS